MNVENKYKLNNLQKK